MNYLLDPEWAANVKALHIVKTAVGGSWVYHQIRVLCSIGVEVVVALPSDTDALAPRYQEAGAQVLKADLDPSIREPWRLPETVRKCRDLVEHVRPDVIHAHHVGPAYVMRLALGKNSAIPRVFQVQGPLHLEHPAFTTLDVRLAGPRDYWIATCQWTYQKYLQLGVESNRVFLSYMGFDVGSFKGNRTGRLREELGIPAGAPLIGMVAYVYAPKWYLGQKTGIKGHEDFIAALHEVNKVRPDVRGVIIGGPWGNAAPYEQRLRARAAKSCNGQLKFTGFRSDVPVIYPDVDLAVVPSHSENVSSSSVEAFLSGIPVVATHVGGLPDLVQDKKTGWLVPPGKPALLARAILGALADPAEARRRTIAGQKLARELFEVERTAREIAAIYRTIVTREPSSRLCA